MNKEYVVLITEKNYGALSVKASSPEEAQELAEQEYEQGDVAFGNIDVQYQVQGDDDE